jgi:hypothetical protein
MEMIQTETEKVAAGDRDKQRVKQSNIKGDKDRTTDRD